MAAPASSLKAVVAALSGNVVVTLVKFIAFFLSGSGAMLSEAIHSAADTGNQVLLFLGLKRAARKRDDEFHYGYGGERFIFGILSASGIFFVGCGVTVYHGLQSLLHPHAAEVGPITFAVLGVSFLIEGGVLVLAVMGLRKQAADMPFLRYVREKADPAAVAILLEDGAAVLGLVLATVGIVLAYVTGNPVWDAAASLTVGVLLGVIAIYLMVENRGLLLGRAVPDDVEQRFVDVVRARPSLADLHDVKTRQITPETFQFKAELRFSESFVAAKLGEALPASGLPAAGASREQALQGAARHLIRALSEEIDAIEAEVRRVIPEAKHIDLELEHLSAEAAEAAEQRSAQAS
ncbi:cobalt transporter [Corallococcus sp. H22C18031201]|uniref:cation diffusion facilitator family transporter n=1 Tax=Citreicoccus inhibens TaxID=2849499 RepID=UPI000E7702CD|nr:cation diffusion facilitator family transporter [Citreicoccus inhibens]MBU8897257.1 cation diffusion facilitator family transporter [Citreicoccus inhibens]RJS21177.1 cobalt transporter [Corallococcus sp. H22C18031201]